MKGLIYFILGLVPTIIIGTTMYFVRDWPTNSAITIVTLFIVMTVSMLLVTYLYVKLMPFVKTPEDEDQDNDDSDSNSNKQA